MIFDMYDYALQTVELYKSLTGIDKVKHAATPFVLEGSISSQDEEARGEPGTKRMSYTYEGPLARTSGKT